MAATVATKVAIVAVATVTVAGAGSVVRDTATAPHRDAGPAVAAPSSPRARPISASAPAPASPQRSTFAPAAGSALHAPTGSHPTSPSPKPSPGAKAKGPPATGALPTQAQHGRGVAKGQATAQAKREAVPSRGRRSDLKPAKSHPAHPAKGTPPAAAVNARPAHPEHPAISAGPSAHAQPAGTQGSQPAADAAPAVTPPPGNSGAAHSTK